MKTKKQLTVLWGNHLYKKLSPWIDKDGYITDNWASIVENNFQDWDKDYIDTNEKSDIYYAMYNLEFEPHPENELLIRPIDYD